MINKKEILDFIDKYSLGGILENVKWVIDNNNHLIYMGGTTDDSNIDVEVTLKKNYDIQSLNVGIKSTLTLKKMISVLNDNIISITPSFRGDLVTKLKFDDGEIEVTYVGSDLAIVKPYTPIKTKGNLVLRIKIDDNFISKFLKAKNAMNGESLFKIVKTNDKLKLSLGYSDRNTDRINLNITSDFDNLPSDYPVCFNVEYFKQVLTNNKGDSQLEVYCKDDKYISVIEFDDELYSCKYILYQRLDDEM